VQISVVVAIIQLRSLKTEVEKGDDPLNLSISVSGGKETNQDSPSNSE